MNMKPFHAEKQISELFQNLSPLPRLQILQAIGEGEACVCHLETMLGQRQAYISQHLMALRQAGVVVSRREGRNVFYRLANPEVLSLIEQAGKLLGFSEEEGLITGVGTRLAACPCPHCDEKETSFMPGSQPALSINPR
jgi:DNA-binding transcriptional ArsR family regulator